MDKETHQIIAMFSVYGQHTHNCTIPKALLPHSIVRLTDYAGFIYCNEVSLKRIFASSEFSVAVAKINLNFVSACRNCAFFIMKRTKNEFALLLHSTVQNVLYILK